MNRFLPAMVVVGAALFSAAEAKAQYPYPSWYGSYTGMRLSQGNGGGYSFSTSPAGSHSSTNFNLRGGGYDNAGSAPCGSCSGMSFNHGGGSYYNAGSYAPSYRAFRRRPYYAGYGPGY